ncbi:hypothetical protein GETHPA_08740 [Geothrix rubra]|uniref:Uncharacterized protein n=1 Tax=Geothrix rubra TaxID=2927977 RepID=A0ABQ5Q4W1_9BACT|nr:hypothetical protein [Geothrix rubra]GLH69341.1 hypothetical protein GETHPA_08740 [Geothrix rubra]
MFVAVASLPTDPDGVRRAADIAGIAQVDAARLLAGTPPRVLVRATQDGARIVEALAAAGFTAFVGEVAAIQGDKDRVVARNLECASEGFVAVDGRGQRHECPAASIAAFLRGHRTMETSELVKTTERKLDLGKALLTSGLAITKKVETTLERRTSSREPFILVQRNDGLPGIMLYEGRLNYQCLGPALQPSRSANFTALLARLRALAAGAPVDDRITRPGFLAGLPVLSVDPADLAVFLVSEARARGC